MKLTKGKISKLYNKKKQTMKKKANKRKSSKKNRTFRRKQKVNLARKSLKRLRYKKLSGGVGTDDVPKTDEDLGIFPPVTTSEENVTAPLQETSSLNPPLNEELNVNPGAEVSVEAEVVPTTGEASDMSPPAEEITTEEITADEVPPADKITTDEVPVADEITTEEITTDEVPVADEITTDEVPVAEEITADEVPVADEITTDEVPVAEEITSDEVPVAEEITSDEDSPEITSDEVSPEQIDVNEEEYQENVDVQPTDADLLAQENAAQEYKESNIENKQTSIETKFTDLVNEIASKTAKKIEEKLTGEEVAEQNPADALLSVANTFGSDTSVGGKKRRSRRFRLLKKQNRTKRT
jgi:hypothetical protein